MRYLFIDLETTGLGADTLIAQVGFVLTDEKLTEIAAYEANVDVRHFVVDSADHAARLFEPRAMEMHQKTGLLQQIAAGNCKPLAEIEDEVIEWLGVHGVMYMPPEKGQASRDTIQIGNQPNFDRRYIERDMLKIASVLHYRMIDVSTMRQIAALITGLTGDRLKAAMRIVKGEDAKQHTALADIRHCQRELMFFGQFFDGNRMMQALRDMGAIG